MTFANIHLHYRNEKNQFKFIIILFHFYSWLFCYIFKIFQKKCRYSINLIKYQIPVTHFFCHLPSPRDTSITQSLRHICCGDGIVMLLNQEKYLYLYLNDAPKLRKRIDWKKKTRLNKTNTSPKQSYWCIYTQNILKCFRLSITNSKRK